MNILNNNNDLLFKDFFEFFNPEIKNYDIQELKEKILNCPKNDYQNESDVRKLTKYEKKFFKVFLLTKDFRARFNCLRNSNKNNS